MFHIFMFDVYTCVLKSRSVILSERRRNICNPIHLNYLSDMASLQWIDILYCIVWWCCIRMNKQDVPRNMKVDEYFLMSPSI